MVDDSPGIPPKQQHTPCEQLGLAEGLSSVHIEGEAASGKKWSHPSVPRAQRASELACLTYKPAAKYLELISCCGIMETRRHMNMENSTQAAGEPRAVGETSLPPGDQDPELTEGTRRGLPQSVRRAHGRGPPVTSAGDAQRSAVQPQGEEASGSSPPPLARTGVERPTDSAL
ncbi:unnamed protein product [Rangifer tarandus platyrhynchus]|uniref:Uncharacterized protein n=1 Tax=Rangifer tarandus platyrhynchus TaxID=3082113 RepID=A0AC59Z1F3_RANTA